MEALGIGILLGATFVCIAAFFIGMLEGDTDISDIVHQYIMELSLRQLLSLRRQLDARIEELKSGHVSHNNLKGREVYHGEEEDIQR